MDGSVLKDALGREWTSMTSVNTLLAIEPIWKKIKKEMSFPDVNFPCFDNQYMYGILGDSIHHTLPKIWSLSDVDVIIFFEATANHYKVIAKIYKEGEADIGDIIFSKHEKHLISNPN